MRDAFIHIGLPKTGSTTLQEWLKLNAAAIAERGQNAIASMAAHRIAVEPLTGKLGKRDDVVAIRKFMSLAQAANHPGDGTLILSSEYFSLANPVRLRAVLDRLGIVPRKIIAYVRRQDIICASGYAQEIKALSATHIVERVSYSKFLDWDRLYTDWLEICDNVVLINYESVKSDLVRSFCKATELDDEGMLDAPCDFNQSLNAEMTEVARLLNERNLRFDPVALGGLEGWYPNIRFGFSTHITKAFEKKFIASNRRLASRFPGIFDDFAAAGWDSQGQDFAGMISDEHLNDVLRYITVCEGDTKR